MTANTPFWENDWSSPQATLDQELVAQLGFIPGLKELLMVRQVHALEHATVWMLTEFAEQYPAAWRQNYAELGGMSTEKGFHLYGEVDKVDLYRAVNTARDRLQSGEWHLAVHPRCGTNLSVTMLLTAGLTGGASFLMPKDPFSQLVGMGTAAATALAIAPEFGKYAQQYITTAIPFNLAVEKIEASTDWTGQPSQFVQVRWQAAQ